MILSSGLFLRNIYIEQLSTQMSYRFNFLTSRNLDSYGLWIETDLNFVPVSEFESVENYFIIALSEMPCV